MEDNIRAIVRSQNWFPSIFNDLFNDEWLGQRRQSTPAINVIENEKDYRIELAAPGMNKDDVKVSVDDDNEIVIATRRKAHICAANSPTVHSVRASCFLTMWTGTTSRPKLNMAC